MYKPEDPNSVPIIADVLHKISFQLAHSNLAKKNRETGRMVKDNVSMQEKKIAGVRKFVFNRPFLFFVQEEESGAMLIIGRVINPSDKVPTRVTKPTTISSTQSCTQMTNETTTSTKLTTPTTSKTKNSYVSLYTAVSANKAHRFNFVGNKIFLFNCINIIAKCLD